MRACLAPATCALLAWLGLRAGHALLPEIADPQLRRALAWCFLPGSFVLQVGAPLLVAPACRRRGAGPFAATVAGLVPMIAWWAWECAQTAAVFPLGPTLYYAVGPLFLLPFALATGFAAVAELAFRRRERLTDPARRVLTPTPIAGLVLAPVALWLLLLWEGGVHAFYVYQELYKALFS